MLAVIIYGLAKRQILFTFVEKETMVFVKRGESLVRVIINKPNHIIVKNDDGHFVVEKSKDTDLMRRISELSGIFYLGIPIVDSVKEFNIEYTREGDLNGDLTKWIEGGTKIGLNNLRTRITIYFAVPSVHTMSGADINVAVSIVCDLINPYKIVEELKGKFISSANDVIKEAVLSVFAKINGDISDILRFDKKKLGDLILKNIKDDDQLEEITGIKVVEVIVPMIQVSDQRLRDALNSVQTAKQDLLAATDKAKAIRLEQEASVADIARIAEMMKENPDQASLIADIAKAERLGQGGKGPATIVDLRGGGKGSKKGPKQ